MKSETEAVVAQVLDLRKEVDRLRAREQELLDAAEERDRLRASNGKLVVANSSLVVENTRLRAALKPFAEWGEMVVPMLRHYGDDYVHEEFDDPDCNVVQITKGDLRRAAEALAEENNNNNS